ncbi:unnamed protein product [Trichobilharzia regenti]|nr:unnamed protein product [Trichobilharzia regenti]
MYLNETCSVHTYCERALNERNERGIVTEVSRCTGRDNPDITGLTKRFESLTAKCEQHEAAIASVTRERDLCFNKNLP